MTRNPPFPGPAKSSTQPSLVRVLGVRDGIAIVVGTVIGSGIFLVPGPIAQK